MNLNKNIRRGAPPLLYSQQRNPNSNEENNQKLIKEVVDEIDGVFLPVYPSEANMMAIDLSGAGISPKDMSNYLLKRKIFTREGEYTSNLFGDNYLRISYSIPEEQIKVFCEEFPKAVEALRK